MGDAGAEGGLARFVQHHERALILAWLGGCVAVLVFLAVWAIGTRGAERAVEAWDARWTDELDAAEVLVRAQRFDEAAARLERLDPEFPANFIKHRLDRERERLLALLGESYVGLGKKGKALATFERLAAFDPKNFDNHFRRAEALRSFGELDPAGESFQSVLAIHPTHLPSVTAVIDMAFDAGEYARVAEAYQAYLDAWLLARVRVSCGERALELDVQADGREHALEGTLELPAGWSGTLCLETRGYSVRLGSIEISAPLRVGVAEPVARTLVDARAAWRPSDGRATDAGFSADTAQSRLCVDGVELANGAARVRVTLTVFKTLPSELWQQVAKSYQNRLELAALREAERRSLVGGCPQAGSVFED